MHNKYAPQGMTAISVALVNPQATPEKDKEVVLKLLKQEKAIFPNFYLDEKDELWQEKFKSAGPPIVYVFNRDGKYKKFEGGDIGEDLVNVDKLVAEWVKK